MELGGIDTSQRGTLMMEGKRRKRHIYAIGYSFISTGKHYCIRVNFSRVVHLVIAIQLSETLNAFGYSFRSSRKIFTHSITAYVALGNLKRIRLQLT